MSDAIALTHEENGSYGISFPDFPGCVSTAATIDEVIAKGGQALALHVEGMMADGEALPPFAPRSSIARGPGIG